MKDDGEPVEVSDVQRAKVVVEGIVDEQVIDGEEPQLRMFVFRRRCVECAQIQTICSPSTMSACNRGTETYLARTLSSGGPWLPTLPRTGSTYTKRGPFDAVESRTGRGLPGEG